MAFAERIPVRVTNVISGDTIVITGSKSFRVRLADIDAPELGHSRYQIDQPFAGQARDALRRMLDGRKVVLDVRDIIRETTTFVGTLYADGQDVNLALVKAGYAWEYSRYSERDDLSAAQATARSEHRGLWAGDDPIAPWLWRAEGMSDADWKDYVLLAATTVHSAVMSFFATANDAIRRVWNNAR